MVLMIGELKSHALWQKKLSLLFCFDLLLSNCYIFIIINVKYS